ncbi:hypothetical protein [Shewanella algae]|jgi:hypothetical protein|uniref:hypothetical protein n=1 Tax=Shewanella algae TaxID=38313 RepID=UPI000D653B61|nr:hypothetical protein [Shewanella algae]MBC8798485.1 hypothetical protein [Shewanella algae]PWF90401.1 hypothetical protein DD549_18800 [Shewanella algae]
MIKQVLTTSFISLGIGFLAELLNVWLGSKFLYGFFESNLVTILVALLAVNAATMGIVLTKMRDLIDKNGNAEAFKKTRSNMLLSIKEQIGLIILATIVLSVKSAPVVQSIENMPLFFNSIVTGIFVYALLVLYDTAKGVLVIVDFNG